MSWYKKMSREESDQPREYPLCAPGIYPFTVKKAQAKMSQGGNEMIALELIVLCDHIEYTVFDYLVGTETMAWKIRHFCDAVKLDKEYEDDSFDALMCRGRSGFADIGKQEAKEKPGGGMYAAKNVVLDYVLTQGGHLKSDLSVPPKKDDDFKEDDLPF